MKLLVTGFDAFGGEKVNPAQLVVESLPDEINENQVLKLIIPTIRYGSAKKIMEVIDQEKPDIVVSIGQAGGNDHIAIERVAINCDDYRIQDNGGNQPIDEPIVEEGPTAYFSTLPIRKIYEVLQKEEYPVRISNSAGTFVCNHVFYSIRHYIEENHLSIQNGFIHIPYIKEQVEEKPNVTYMELNKIQEAIKLALQTILKERGCPKT